MTSPPSTPAKQTSYGGDAPGVAVKVHAPGAPTGTLQQEPAYLAGWSAQRQGLGPEACPHRDGLYDDGTQSRLRRLWLQGWHDAKRERGKA